jgi:hypothetical protein
MGKSKFFNSALRGLVDSEGGGLDRLWLPTGQVEKIGEMGKYEGVKINFDAGEVFPDEYLERNLPFHDLSIDGSGDSSKYLYDVLKQAEELDEFLSLSRIQIRREIDGEFVRESITNKGSFTTRGGSDVRLHVAVVNQVKDQYAQLLNNIEQNHIIGAESKEVGGRAQGSPVNIQFSRPVHDVGEFLSYVVNSKDPFRLWGHSRETGEDSYKVDGVDAHNGDKFMIEMSSEWLRLYLYKGACGNTALRLFTNIQQYYDPAAELIMANA